MSLLLHTGTTTHVRHTPFVHKFGYRMWMLSVDLDDPAETRLFHRNRPGVVSLHNADHGPRDGTPLRPWVEAHLARLRLDAFAARIRFMVIPRVLGYAFNPIALFTCHDAAGTLGAVIHQVKNTFGDQTAYVLPVASEPGPIRQETAKRMHVSPFFDMAGGYRFAFNNPTDEDFRLTIRYGAEAQPRMTAALHLRTRPLTDTALARLLLAMPLMPAKVFTAIHWEALRLKLKGASYHPLPAPVLDPITGTHA
jgi:DUF1365 family protein